MMKYVDEWFPIVRISKIVLRFCYLFEDKDLLQKISFSDFNLRQKEDTTADKAVLLQILGCASDSEPSTAGLRPPDRAANARRDLTRPAAS